MLKGMRRLHLSRIRGIVSIRYSCIISQKFYSVRPNHDSLQLKVSNYIRAFIKQEALALSESINRNLLSLEEHNDNDKVTPAYNELEPRLKHDFDKLLDNQNRLFFLLTFNPIIINPHLYISVYENLDTPIETTVKLLLFKRLLFHQQYDDCWKICMETYTSLTDIEDFLEVAFKALEENHNLTFGLFQLLIASQNDFTNQRLQNHIIDTICFKFNIRKTWIQENFSILLDIRGINTTEDLEHFKFNNLDIIQKNPNIQLLYLKKHFMLLDREISSQECFDIITEFENLMKYSGWLSLVAPPFTGSSCLPNAILKTYSSSSSIAKVITQTLHLGKEINLNENDITYILRSNPQIKSYTIYLLYMNVCSSKRLPNKHIINYFMNDVLFWKNYTQIKSILFENFSILDDEVLIRGLEVVFTESKTDFDILVLKIFKRVSKDHAIRIFQLLVTNLLQNQRTIGDIHIIFKLCMRSNIKARECLKVLTTNQYTPQEVAYIHNEILKDKHLKSTLVVLEIARNILLRSPTIDYDMLPVIFDKILAITLKKDVILSRTTRTVKFDHDIQKLLALANSTEKAVFHNSFRALGQTISLKQPRDIAKAIDTLHEHIFHRNFLFVRSKYGREYLLNGLVNEIMRFSERANSSEQAILKIRDILGHTSNSIVQGFLFRLMVKQDPQKSLKLLQHYQNNKRYLSGVIHYMISGIFSTSNLDKNQKIHTFDLFIKTLKELGYRHKVRQSTAFQLLHLLNKRNGDATQLSESSRTWVLDFFNKRKELNRVIKKRYKMHKT